MVGLTSLKSCFRILIILFVFCVHNLGTISDYWICSDLLASIIETGKLNNVEPHAYLTGVLTAIAIGNKQNDIEDLLPWNFEN